MKSKFLIILACIFIISPVLFSETDDKEFILSAMSFPEPVLIIGGLINNPMFTLGLLNRNNNPEILKKKIQKAEKEIKNHPGPEDLYKLGSLYKEIYDYDNAIKYYKLSLKAFDFSGINSPEYYKELIIKGYIYFYLAEVDIKSRRIENLEKSQDFFKKAIEVKPEKDLWVMLGDCYLVSGKMNEALYCYKYLPYKDGKIDYIHARIQAALFQADYNKLAEDLSWQKIKNIPLLQFIDFENIQTAVNNSSGQDRDILKIQHYVYLMKLLLLKEEAFRLEKSSVKADSADIFTGDEKAVIEEADKYIKSAGKKCLRPASYNYILGIICFLKSDYKNSVLFFENSLKENEYPETIYKEIIYTLYEKMNDYNMLKNFISDKISKYPEASDYLILAHMEFKNKNFSRAAMLCNESLRINNDYPEAFSALTVVFAYNGNYFAADEMIKKANHSLEEKTKINRLLRSQIKVNEAAIALLKNEKERAYVILRSVLTADNDEKAAILYKRFFIKDGKIQN